MLAGVLSLLRSSEPLAAQLLPVVAHELHLTQPLDAARLAADTARVAAAIGEVVPSKQELLSRGVQVPSMRTGAEGGRKMRM
jgi:hypothetical protein